MQRETFPVGPLQCNCSILYDVEAHDATVVDPGGDLAKILGFLGARGLKLRQIVVTHAHLDHIAGAKLLSEQTGAPVLLHQDDLPLLALMEQQAEWIGVPTPSVAPPDLSAEDGLKLVVGSETGEVFHTPGHTQGSISLHFPSSNLLLAGDTLFRGGIGRTDLWGGDSKQILRSIHDRLLPLPEDTVVVAGHGLETTIGYELKRNPFLVK
jgi:glyoxylase-like metal-dependent hydrolase (beta-lactamase superfamily II)